MERVHVGGRKLIDVLLLWLNLKQERNITVQTCPLKKNINEKHRRRVEFGMKI